MSLAKSNTLMISIRNKPYRKTTCHLLKALVSKRSKLSHSLKPGVSITFEIAVHDSPLKAAVWQVYDSIFSENQGKLAGGVRQSRRRYTAGNRLLLKPLQFSFEFWKPIVIILIAILSGNTRSTSTEQWLLTDFPICWQEMLWSWNSNHHIMSIFTRIFRDGTIIFHSREIWVT